MIRKNEKRGGWIVNKMLNIGLLVTYRDGEVELVTRFQ